MLVNHFRYGVGLDLFKDRIPCAPESVPHLARVINVWLGKLNEHLAGKQWVCGDRFTIADMQVREIVYFNACGPRLACATLRFCQ